ncbi:hypothetical protein [Ancylobacter sp.]|uniref:hypothetical protein n=1 Tax=Ancylobacter sp. TaxID=1872567 RepID=UPI003D0FCB4F
MKTTITNNSRALQGVHTTDGMAFIEAGQTRELEVAEDYLPRLKKLPFFSLNGERSADAAVNDGRDVNGDTPEMAELRGRFDEAWAALSAEHEAATAGLAAANSEIVTLKDRVAELELENEDLTKRIPSAVVPEAKHRGAGSYSIMEGDTEIREKLPREQAEAFNALDAAGKAKWLADNPKPAA